MHESVDCPLLPRLPVSVMQWHVQVDVDEFIDCPLEESMECPLLLLLPVSAMLWNFEVDVHESIDCPSFPRLPVSAMLWNLQLDGCSRVGRLPASSSVAGLGNVGESAGGCSRVDDRLLVLVVLLALTLHDTGCLRVFFEFTQCEGFVSRANLELRDDWVAMGGSLGEVTALCCWKRRTSTTSRT